eukprot:11655578-Alexandrium_andersonii.AAC.1
MSASLVGSEMCIRDRLPSTWFPLRSGAAAEPLVSQGPTWVGSKMGSCTPVSYRHLTLPTICSV